MADQSLVMVTTTSIPYMYHVPSILATPKHLPYWFRYLKIYLHPDLITALEGSAVHEGVLYLRDQESAEKLCYPLRRFHILWSDVKGSVSFLNLKMGDYIDYAAQAVSKDEEKPAAPSGVHQASWERLIKHREALFAANKEAAGRGGQVHLKLVPTTMSAPRKGGLPIVPWADLCPTGHHDKLLWLGSKIPEAASAFDDDARAWRDVVGTLAGIERVNRTPFFFVHAPKALTSGKTLKVEQIGKGLGRYSWGFAAKANDNYAVRVDQLTPNALSADAPTMRPFMLTIENSDPGIISILKRDTIDGPYGFYELSFSTKGDRAGTYALLRVSAVDLKLQNANGTEEAVALPDVVVPLELKRSWIAQILWAIVAFLAIVGFVSADQWLPLISLEKTGVAGTLTKAVLFGLAMIAGRNAGFEGLVSSIGKKI